MSELIEEIVQDYRTKNQKLEKTVQQLQEKLIEYENKFGCYTKEQTKLLKKIQEVKEILLNSQITKSGYNNYNDYNYFELQDIIPVIIPALIQKGLTSKFYTNDERLFLQIVDDETGAWDQVSTRLRIYQREKAPKGDLTYLMKDEQAAQTYARRTLWLLMLDIVEPVPEVQEVQQQKKQTLKQKHQNKNINNDFIIPEGMDQITNQILTKIKTDFGTKVPFNNKTLRNKLHSMEKMGQIDETQIENVVKTLLEMGYKI